MGVTQEYHITATMREKSECECEPESESLSMNPFKDEQNGENVAAFSKENKRQRPNRMRWPGGIVTWKRWRLSGEFRLLMYMHNVESCYYRASETWPDEQNDLNC